MKNTARKTAPKASGKKTGKELVVHHQAPMPADPTLALIERAARDKEVDVPKMRELLNMKLEYEAGLKQQAYQEAMCEVQKEMLPVTRKASNTHTRSKYAKLEHISEVIKPVYTRHGFSLTYSSKKMPDGGTHVICQVLHRGGHKETHELEGALDITGAKGNANKTSLQGLGSTISYLRRYLTCMIFDVILEDEDNDGQGDPTAPAAPRQDNFTARATEQAGPPQTKPVDGDWSPEAGVMIKGASSSLKYNDQPDSPAQEVQAANYLKAVMQKRRHKQSRIDLINENLALVRALAQGGHEGTVSELHALADKGE